MKKHTKGAFAAGTAALILLGGVGTLAYWTDSQDIGGGTISSGHLSLTDSASSDWVYAPGNANAGQPVTMIVPGDSIVSTHTYTINASGDNLTATLSTPSSIDTASVTGNTADSLQLPVSVTYDVDGTAVPSTITSANDGDELTATIKVDFPFGDTTVNANDTQDIVAELDDVAITLEQTQNTGA